MIDVILWDLDNTVLDFDYSEESSIRYCFNKLNLGVCTDAMLAEYREINAKYWHLLELGELTQERVLVERFVEFFENHGIDKDLALPFDDMYEEHLPDFVRWVPGAKETILALKNRCRQYLVTNGAKDVQRSKLKSTGLGDLLDGVFISAEIGAQKPSKPFFDIVFKKIGDCPPETVLIVGDSLTSDMRGGVNAGIKTCFYNPSGKPVKTELRLDYTVENIADVLNIHELG